MQKQTYSYQNKKELLVTIVVFVSATILIVTAGIYNYLLPLLILCLWPKHLSRLWVFASWDDPSLNP